MAVAIGCAKVLDSLSSSPKVRVTLHKFGVVKHMERFQIIHVDCVILSTIAGQISQSVRDYEYHF